jgi:phage terminase large subunit-like protein
MAGRPKKAAELDSPQAVFRLLGEKLKASSNRPNVHGYIPHDKQIKFHSSSARIRLYIGGNRSGKTTGGILEDIYWLRGNHPYRAIPEGPIRGRIVTVDFTNGLAKIILPEFARWCAPSYLINGSWEDSYDKTLRTLTFANGSFVEFMSYDQDLDKFAGTSRHFIHFDEEPPEVIYTENKARLIDTGGSHWFTMTPVDGMTWIYDQVYEPGVSGANDSIAVIEVDMTDNPHLGDLEVQEFISGLTEEEKDARIHGKFIQLGGLIYKHFDPQPGGLHVLKDNPEIPKDWVWILSLDHGFNNPTAALWHGVDPEGSVITFREHYQQGWTVDKHAREIHRINKQLGRGPDIFIADPSIRNTDPITGTSIHEEYAKYGLPFALANNDVAAGIVRVAKYMEPRKNGQAMWHVTPNCYNLIKELRRYRWKTYASKKQQSQNNAFDQPHKKDDHAADSLRYAIMSRPELTSEYHARLGSKDSVESAMPEGLGLSMAAYEDEVADPFGRSDRPNKEYASLGTQWVYDEFLGGEY